MTSKLLAVAFTGLLAAVELAAAQSGAYGQCKAHLQSHSHNALLTSTVRWWSELGRSNGRKFYPTISWSFLTFAVDLYSWMDLHIQQSILLAMPPKHWLDFGHDNSHDSHNHSGPDVVVSGSANRHLSGRS